MVSPIRRCPLPNDRKGQAVESVELRAEISGVVIDIVGEQGACVDEGEPVLMMEAMKMEIPVMAPCAGRIVEIRVAKGTVVPEGHVLAILAPT